MVCALLLVCFRLWGWFGDLVVLRFLIGRFGSVAAGFVRYAWL